MPKSKRPDVTPESVTNHQVPVPFRMILRRTRDGRTMIGGVLLSDLCADGHERIWTGQVILVPMQKLKIANPEFLAGQQMTEMMTTHLGVNGPSEVWMQEDDTLPKAPEKKPVGDEHLGKFCYCDQHLRAHSTGWCTVGLRNKKPLTSETVEEAGIECMVKGYELYQMERVLLLPRDLQPTLNGYPTFVERRDPNDGSKATFSKVTDVKKVRDTIGGTQYVVTHEGAFGHKTFRVKPKSKVLVYQYVDYNQRPRAKYAR